jgi:hypothetical protein
MVPVENRRAFGGHMTADSRNFATRDGTKENVSEIAAAIASRLARSRDGGSDVGDPPRTDPIALAEVSRDDCTERANESSIPNDFGSQMLLDNPPRPTPMADEYRSRVDVCLNWAREAHTDEIRLASIALAQAWLRVAMRIEREMSESLPLAPTL